MNASGDVMLGTMDVHHQWTKVIQLELCSFFNLIFFNTSLHLLPVIPAAAQLSESPAANRLVEGKNQLPSGWIPSNPPGTSPAYRWALQHAKCFSQEPDVPTPAPASQEPAWPYHGAGQVCTMGFHDFRFLKSSSTWWKWSWLRLVVWCYRNTGEKPHSN